MSTSNKNSLSENKRVYLAGAMLAGFIGMAVCMWMLMLSENKWVYLAGGMLVGFVGMAVCMWLLMPSMMLTTHYSKYGSIEETCAKLNEAIEQEGWNCPGIRNMNKTMEKHGVIHEEQVRIVELCKANYAHDILTTNPEVSTLMPCAWGVYQDDQGRICITGMNMGLMGEMFGGNIAKIMGGSVAAEEKNMIGKVAAH